MSLFTRETLPDSGPIVVNGNDKADILYKGNGVSGQTGKLLQLQVAGTSKFEVDKDGNITGGAFNPDGNATIATGKTLTVTDADALTVGGKIIPQIFRVAIPVQAAAQAVDQWAFIATRAWKVTAVKEVHSTGSTSGTLGVRKVTDATSGPGAAAGSTVKEMLQSAIDLSTTATANTIQTGTLTATTADLTLASGDKIGLDFGGTVTGYVGMVQLEMQAV